ncbi:MAG TPA: hypothetical protein VIV40_08820 [Kofleriaceae bacterium]
MHRLILVAALAACSHSKASGPKWPEPSTTAEDGGESIAPRPSTTYAAAIEKSADVEDDKPAAAVPATPAAATGDDKPAATPAAAPSTDDVIMTEEIIIEIDD